MGCCLEAVLGTLGSVPSSELSSTALEYYLLNAASASSLFSFNSFSVSDIIQYAFTMSLDFFCSLMLIGLMTVKVFMVTMNAMRNWKEQHVW